MTRDVTFLHGYRTPECAATVDKRFAYHTVQLMTRGGVELFYDDVRHEMTGVWAWPCHPGPYVRFHAWPRTGNWEHRYVAFTGPQATAWEAEGLWLSSPQEVTDPERAARLTAWFDELLAVKEEPGKWAQRTAVNLLERVLLDLAANRRSGGEPRRPEWLDAVMQRLAQFDGGGDDEPDYTALAEQHGMALTTLRRRFREYVGSSLHDYRLHCRINLAKRALGEGTVPIKRVAAELGYGDVFYFSRQFRQRAGVSPAEYRRSRQT
ncbi:MAG TPA: AraC family transcriptional regulator [Tepidisphaeraceae bacterium]|jgi:AraC-like DNA-binding protein|nr:AraC family transcriptional regulator [Tepidisphaeraceae bacterium]